MKTYDKKGRTTRTQVETRTTERVGTTSDTSLATLTPLEEKVIRMLHGLGEDNDKALEFAVGASADARMRLTLMEAHNIASPELSDGIPTDTRSANGDAALQTVMARFADREV